MDAAAALVRASAAAKAASPDTDVAVAGAWLRDRRLRINYAPVRDGEEWPPPKGEEARERPPVAAAVPAL